MNTVIENSVNTVVLVPTIMIKARNTITAYLIPEFPNWLEAGRGEDESEM